MEINNITSKKEGNPEELAVEYSKLIDLVPFSKLVFEFKISGTLTLPIFSGPIIRNQFGSAFKRVSCELLLDDVDPKKTFCNKCSAVEFCPFVYVFESPQEYLSKINPPPPNFVLSTPINLKTIFRESDTFEFGFTLLGKSYQFILPVIEGARRIGKTGFKNAKSTESLILNKVYLENPYNGERQAYFSRRLGIFFEIDKFEAKEAEEKISRLISSDTLTIKFVSPLEFTLDKQKNPELTFANLIRLIIRRANLLAIYNEEENDQAKKPLMSIYDTNKLIDNAKTVETLEYDFYSFVNDYDRLSHSTGKLLKFDGIIGQVTYKGDFSQFIPLLLLGEQLHIGKHTSYGFGEYKIVLEEEKDLNNS